MVVRMRIDPHRDGWDFTAAAAASGHRAAFAVTTNLGIRRDGTAVMGKGIALQAARRFPDLPRRYAAALREGFPVTHFAAERIVTFPTKDDFRHNSDIDLMILSCRELVSVVWRDEIAYIAMPPAGCGNGGLDFAEVCPFLAHNLTPIWDRIVFVGLTPAQMDCARRYQA